MSYKSAFIDEMNSEDIRFHDVSENRVTVSYRGDNTNSIDVVVIFDEDGDGFVALRCWSFGKVPEGRRAAVVETCNQLNDKFRWVKFLVDSDGDLTVSLDAIVDMETVGTECIQLIKRMVNIYDEGYPALMAACWSGN